MQNRHYTRRSFLQATGCGFAALAAAGLFKNVHAATAKPNILFIMLEDMSPYFSFYGDTKTQTPALDAFAAQSVIYTNAFVTVPICAPSRANLGTGLYATSTGAHNMRCRCKVPSEYKHFTAYLHEQGYYNILADKGDNQGAWNGQKWDAQSKEAQTNLWRNRGGKPFFAQVGGGPTHEVIFKNNMSSDTSRPDSFPPYLVENERSIRSFNEMYDRFPELDMKIKNVLDMLKEDGLEDDTIVIFTHDHGAGVTRHKRWVLDSGLRVPFVVRIPEKYRRPGKDIPGTRSDELISFVDLAPTFINLAGGPIPAHLQGRAFLGTNLTPEREYVFGSRDRADERYECIRAVRSKKHKYIRNFMPWVPYFAYLKAPENNPQMQELRKARNEGRLPEAAKKYFTGTKPYEELYDIEKDPHELNNIAGLAENQPILKKMRAALQSHMIETRDLGLMPEPEFVPLKKQYQTEWNIVRQGTENPVKNWLDAIAVTEKGKSALDDMIALLADSDRVIRYWACIGIGNLGTDAQKAVSKLIALLGDEAVSVQVAAARALYYISKSTQALDALENIAKNSTDKADLFAANVLDAIGADGHARIERIKGTMTHDYIKSIALYYGIEPYLAPPFNFGASAGIVSSSQSTFHRKSDIQLNAHSKQGSLQLRFKEPTTARITIIDSRGRICARHFAENTEHAAIDCARLPAGNYSVAIYTDKKRIVNKLALGM